MAKKFLMILKTRANSKFETNQGRETFDKYQLISALHSFLSIQNKKYEKVLPPLKLLSKEKQKELISRLKQINFLPNKNIAA